MAFLLAADRGPPTCQALSPGAPVPHLRFVSRPSRDVSVTVCERIWGQCSQSKERPSGAPPTLVRGPRKPWARGPHELSATVQGVAAGAQEPGLGLPVRPLRPAACWVELHHTLWRMSVLWSRSGKNVFNNNDDVLVLLRAGHCTAHFRGNTSFHPPNGRVSTEKQARSWAGRTLDEVRSLAARAARPTRVQVLPKGLRALPPGCT